MGFNLNNAPKEKPTEFDNSPLADGRYAVTIEKVEYTTSSNNNPMLSIRFKTQDKGRFIFDQIMDDPTKQINLYRVSRLLTAVGVTPKGELDLKDLTKLLKKGMELVVSIKTKNNFTNIDISGDNEGYYPIGGHPDPVGEPGQKGKPSSQDPLGEPKAPDVDEDDDSDDPFPTLQTSDDDSDF